MFGKWGLGAPGSTSDPTENFDTFYGYNCQREAHSYYPDHLWSNNERVELDGKTYSHDLIAQASLKFIRDNKDTPFFCYVPTTIPHAAMHVPEDSAGPFRKQFSQFEDLVGKYAGTQFRNPAAAFAGMMTRLDGEVGAILNLLEELGIADNTLVMLTSDNGPHKEGGHQPEFFNSNGPLKGHKRDLYEGGIRAPLLAMWPGKIKAGVISDVICAHWDMLPTFCELADAEIPGDVDGISLVPTLTGQGQQKLHDYLYWEFSERGRAQAVRMRKWKAVKNDIKKNPNAPIELYDLSQDVGETRNIAADHSEMVKKMAGLLKEAHVPSKTFPLFPSEAN